MNLKTLSKVGMEWKEKVYEFGHPFHKQAPYPQATKSFFLCFFWTTERLITACEVEQLQRKGFSLP